MKNIFKFLNKPYNFLQLHLKSAKELNKKLQAQKQIQDIKIFFQSTYLKDNLLIKINSLLFIRSANNYIEVFWKEKNAIKNQLIRTSMLKAEELMKNFEFVLKCHRSYIINVNHVEQIEGNSRGYKLFYNKINFSIPVSKTYKEKFKELFNIK